MRKIAMAVAMAAVMTGPMATAPTAGAATVPDTTYTQPSVLRS